MCGIPWYLFRSPPDNMHQNHNVDFKSQIEHEMIDFCASGFILDTDNYDQMAIICETLKVHYFYGTQSLLLYNLVDKDIK